MALWGNPPGYAPEYLYALATMNYVQAKLSPANHFRLTTAGRLPALLDPEKCLEVEAGLCGHHVDTFDKVFKKCLPKATLRAVEFYLHDEKNGMNRNHVVIEVLYKQHWRFFDVSWGTFFLRRNAEGADDVLSVDQVRALARAGRSWRDLGITNASQIGFRRYLFAQADPFDYLYWPDTDLLVAPESTIHLRPDAGKTSYSLQNIAPNIGFVTEYCGNVRNIKLRLEPQLLTTKSRKTLEIVLAASADGPGNSSLSVCAKSRVLYEVPLRQFKPNQVVEISLGNADDLVLQVNSPDRQAYLVLKSVRVK